MYPGSVATSAIASVIGVFGALLVSVLAMMWRSIADLGREMRQFGERLVRLEVEVRHLTSHLPPPNPPSPTG